MNTIILKPELKELYALNEFILNEIPHEDLQVNLIVEEIFANIVNYSKTEFITVNAEYENSKLTLEFIDNGIEFNPLLKENPTIPESIDEAQIGGLGIFLTKEIADELDYQHINGENHLKIIKKVKK
ncbi:MAG: ATP-binding protein [Methanobrevibacter sp.]|nr:ATP-binding protein [Methanobrevibacter sp.]